VTILVATSVVRGSHQGESHGGVYLIDLERERVVQTVDWNTADIDWQGRGWDRGLRGIAFDGERVYIAASDELFAYTPDFRLVDSWRNPYLRHCHEIAVYQRRLYLTSTGYDALLGFDLDAERFCWGLHVVRGHGDFRGTPFDPVEGPGPEPGNRLHLNMIHCDDRGMHFSGLRTGALLTYDGRRIVAQAGLPQGVHNARPFREGVLFNDTQADVVRYATPGHEQAFRVPVYDPDELTHTELDDTRIARQAFGRGLAVIDDHRIAAGSSPSTVAIHDLAAGRTRMVVTLTKDIRNAVHGLEVWPY
jgi:hypothetical protein